MLIGGAVAAVGLLLAARLGRASLLGVVGLGLAASLAGPTAYTLSTLNTGHQGSIVTAGPSGASMGGPGGGRGGGPGGGGGQPPGQGTGQGGPGQATGNTQGAPPGGQGQDGQGQDGQGQNQQGQNQQGQAPGGGTPGTGGMPGGGMGEGGPGGGGGGMGGLLGGSSVSSEATTLLGQDSDAYTWVAAAIGSQNAASYQLATGEPVMAIGGFNGSDPSPTLAQFKRYVTDGKIHYFVSGGGMGGGGGMGSEGTSSQISAWVEENFTEVTAGSASFYDLTRPVTDS